MGGDGEGQLDVSVYKRPEQLVNCMGCCKGSLRVKTGKVMDERVQEATDGGELWSTYLVQHLRGDERAMKTHAGRSAHVVGRASGTRKEGGIPEGALGSKGLLIASRRHRSPSAANGWPRRTWRGSMTYTPLTWRTVSR